MKRLLALVFTVAALAGCESPRPAPTAAGKLDEGWRQYRFGDFTSAISTFEALLAGAEKNPEIRAQALYGLGITWDLRRPDEDRGKARDYYDQVLQTAPGSDVAPWALLALARMEELHTVGEKTDLAAARKAYEKVMAQYPFHPAAEEALLYEQAMNLATLDPELARQSVEVLRRFATTHPETKYISQVWSLIGAGEDLRGQPREAVECAIRSYQSQEIDPAQPMSDLSGSYWSIATAVEFRLGDFDLARKYYQLLIDNYPTDFRAFGARKAIERMSHVEAAVREGQPLPEFPGS